MPKIHFKRLNGYDASVPLPAYETAGAAGADIRASFLENRNSGRTLGPGERTLVPTGLAVELPQGYEMQIRPRSGLALKHGISLVNSPGTIDADYRGPIGIILINHGQDDVHISHGDRVAQIVISPVVQAEFSVVDELDQTDRGDDGFGSTGTV